MTAFSGAFSVFYADPRKKGESIKRKEKEEESKKKREEEEKEGEEGGEEGALAYQVRPKPPFLKNNIRFFWFALFCFFSFSCT